jgi:hypothetical protein
VQVHCDEGVATRIGPESCADVREGVGEALTGERTGQPLSCERLIVPGADAVSKAEGKTSPRVIASVATTRRSRRPWHVRMLFVREPGELQLGHPPLRGGPHREGEEP